MINAIRIASALHFVLQYGLKGDVFGVMHRMRTWYNGQARQMEREGKNKLAHRFHHAAESMSARIKEVEEFYA